MFPKEPGCSYIWGKGEKPPLEIVVLTTASQEASWDLVHSGLINWESQNIENDFMWL